MLSNLGKKLPNELALRQFLLVNAISIEKKENVKRNVEFMATAVVGAQSIEDLRIKRFPAGAVLLKNADKLDANKINNFKAVVNVVNNMDLDEGEKKLFEEVEQELLSQQKPLPLPKDPEIKPKENFPESLKEPKVQPKEIKEELVDEHKTEKDASLSPRLIQIVKEDVKNVAKEMEQGLGLRQKSQAEVKPVKGIKEELVNEHNSDPDIAASPDINLSVEKNAEKTTNLETTETDSADARAKVFSAEIQKDVEPAKVSGIAQAQEILNDSDSSDFEMDEKEEGFESNISDEEKSENTTTEQPVNIGEVNRSDIVLNGRDKGVTRVDDSIEDVSSKEENVEEETSDKIDCDIKVSDNLDVSRESIEVALTDMLEAAEDVIKSLESESQ